MIDLPIADHALFAPSAASRWPNCNASVDFADEQTDDFTKVQANFGTEIHAWLRQTWEQNDEDTAETPRHWTADQHQAALTCLREWEKYVPKNAQMEVRLFSKRWPNLLFGTIDGLWFDNDDNPEISDIDDLKTGYMGVNVRNNAQLMTYSFLVAEHFPTVKTFRTRIIQPLRDYAESCTYTLAQIQAFGERIAKAIDSPPSFNPGAWCEFCPARATCSALHNSLLGLLREASELNLWQANLAGKTELSY